MSLNTRLIESIDIVAGMINTDFNSDATSDIVSLKNYDGCLVLLIKPSGSAGDDPTLSLLQQTNVSAGSAKALNIKEFYAKVGTQTSVNTWTKYVLTTAAATVATDSITGTSYTAEGNVGTAESATDLTSDVSQAMFLIDVRASDLDVAGGFDCISYFNEGDDFGNAMLGTVIFIPYGARYPSRIPKTAITN